MGRFSLPPGMQEISQKLLLFMMSLYVSCIVRLLGCSQAPLALPTGMVGLPENTETRSLMKAWLDFSATLGGVGNRKFPVGERNRKQLVFQETDSRDIFYSL